MKAREFDATSPMLPSRLPAWRREQRLEPRFTKATLIMIRSEQYGGDCLAIARNVSSGGLLAEMEYAPALGSIVDVHFQLLHPAPAPTLEPAIIEIIARAEVKHHHILNFVDDGQANRARAVGLRFLEFIDGASAPAWAIH